MKVCDLWPRPVSALPLRKLYANVTGMQSSVLLQVHKVVLLTRGAPPSVDPPPSKVGFGDPERDVSRCQWGDHREIRSNLSLNPRLE